MKSRRFALGKVFIISLIVILIALLIPQAAVADAPPGTDPNYPIIVNLDPHQMRLSPGHLDPGQETWFALNVAEIGGAARQPLDLSLFVTPGEGNAIQNVRMDLFPGDFNQHWSLAHVEDTGTFGQGRIVEHEGGDPLLGEMVWNGHVNNNEPVFVCLLNNNSFGVDYWFYTENVIDAEFGPAPEPAAIPVVYPSQNPLGYAYEPGYLIVEPGRDPADVTRKIDYAAITGQRVKPSWALDIPPLAERTAVIDIEPPTLKIDYAAITGQRVKPAWALDIPPLVERTAVVRAELERKIDYAAITGQRVKPPWALDIPPLVDRLEVAPDTTTVDQKILQGVTGYGQYMDTIDQKILKSVTGYGQ